MLENVKHIIFDLGQVILNLNPAQGMLALHELGIANFDERYNALKEALFFEKFETNEISEMRFLETFKELAPEVSDEKIITAWNSILGDFPIRRLQILQQLQIHYDLVLLSNTNVIHERSFNQTLFQQHGIPNIGVFFDKVYYSHLIGLRKPNPEVYQLVLNECSFEPRETLFIDDMFENIQSASGLGIQTIWLESHMAIERDIFRNMK